MEAYNDILILGVAYKGHELTVPSTYFHVDEMTDDFADSLVGLPVYVEHDTKFQIGRVHAAFISASRKPIALLHIYGMTAVNRNLPRALETGMYQSFSLGNRVRAQRDKFDRLRVVENTPTEISICHQGVIDDTDILGHWVIPATSDVDSMIRKLNIPIPLK